MLRVRYLVFGVSPSKRHWFRRCKVGWDMFCACQQNECFCCTLLSEGDSISRMFQGSQWMTRLGYFRPLASELTRVDALGPSGWNLRDPSEQRLLTVNDLAHCHNQLRFRIPNFSVSFVCSLFLKSIFHFSSLTSCYLEWASKARTIYWGEHNVKVGEVLKFVPVFRIPQKMNICSIGSLRLSEGWMWGYNTVVQGNQGKGLCDHA